jgi:hypothetical protein
MRLALLLALLPVAVAHGPQEPASPTELSAAARAAAAVPVEPSAGCAQPLRGGHGPENHMLRFQGLKRTYWMIVPNRTFTKASPAPLVLARGSSVLSNTSPYFPFVWRVCVGATGA